jgi:hypothetical protein
MHNTQVLGELLPAVREELVPRAEANLAAWLARADAADADSAATGTINCGGGGCSGPISIGGAGEGGAAGADGGESSPALFSLRRRRSSALRRASSATASPMQSSARSPGGWGDGSPLQLLGRRWPSSPALKNGRGPAAVVPGPQETDAAPSAAAAAAARNCNGGRGAEGAGAQ